MLTSLKLAIICLVLMMLLVIACTLAQVDMGTNGAVNHFMPGIVPWPSLRVVTCPAYS